MHKCGNLCLLFSAFTWLEAHAFKKADSRASSVHLGHMISRELAAQGPLDSFHCDSWTFLSASALRCILIKIKWRKNFRIPHCIFFSKEEPKFQYTTGINFRSDSPQKESLLRSPLHQPLWLFSCHHSGILEPALQTLRRDLWWNYTEEMPTPNCCWPSSHLFRVCGRDQTDTWDFNMYSKVFHPEQSLSLERRAGNRKYSCIETTSKGCHFIYI